MGKLASIIVEIDSREKNPWIFSEEEKKAGKIQILGSEIGTIEAGDYRIKDHPDLVVIEKKSGFRELFGNYSPSSNKERFHREMEKMKDIKYKYLIIEGNISQDVISLTVPQFSQGNQPPCSRVIEWLFDLHRQYGIVPIFAGDAGQRVAKTIFKQIARDYL